MTFIIGYNMEFKIGDKVWVEADNWCEECTVIKMGLSRTVMYVRRQGGYETTIYKSWATKIQPKGQMVFNFYARLIK